MSGVVGDTGGHASATLRRKAAGRLVAAHSLAALHRLSQKPRSVAPFPADFQRNQSRGGLPRQDSIGAS